MHEMVDEGNTEGVLKESCKQVGEHLYIRGDTDLDVKPLTEEEKADFQVVFLMGGRGTRLRHITKDKYSKHLIDVKGKPISRHVVDMWVNRGFSNISILTDDTHRGKGVMDYYKNGEGIGANIKYSVETTKLSSGGAMKQAIENGAITTHFINHFPDDVVIGYPNFADDLASVFNAAIKAGFKCVIVCAPGKLYPYGVVEDKDGKVVDFIEKPFVSMDSNTGIFAISKELFPLIEGMESEKDIKIERTVLKKVAQEGKMLKVLLPTEYWIPINDEPHLKKFVEIAKQNGD